MKTEEMTEFLLDGDSSLSYEDTPKWQDADFLELRLGDCPDLYKIFCSKCKLTALEIQSAPALEAL